MPESSYTSLRIDRLQAESCSREGHDWSRPRGTYLPPRKLCIRLQAVSYIGFIALGSKHREMSLDLELPSGHPENRVLWSAAHMIPSSTDCTLLSPSCSFLTPYSAQ